MGAGAAGVGAWVAFSARGRDRLVGQIVQVCGSETRIWCSELTEVVPVAPGEIIEEVPFVLRRGRRISADGS